MGLPLRKSEEAPELAALSSAELLELVREAGPLAQAAYEFLCARITATDAGKARFEAVRQLGPASVSREAIEMREDWKAHLVYHIRFTQRHQSREALVREIKAFCLQRRYRGKNGEQIKQSTIRRWLTGELEQEIRDLALVIPS